MRRIKTNIIHQETLENLCGNLTNKVLKILTSMNHHFVEYLEHQTRPEGGHNGLLFYHTFSWNDIIQICLIESEKKDRAVAGKSCNNLWLNNCNDELIAHI